MRIRILVLLCALIAGCAQQSVLPVFPKARYINSEQSSGVVELDDATVTVATYEVWEHIEPVGDFYNTKLTGESWEGHHKDGQDLAFYSDGNFKIGRNLDTGEPLDASKPGHAVMLSEMEGRTMIRLFSSVPKAKEG